MSDDPVILESLLELAGKREAELRRELENARAEITMLRLEINRLRFQNSPTEALARTR